MISIIKKEPCHRLFGIDVRVVQAFDSIFSVSGFRIPGGAIFEANTSSLLYIPAMTEVRPLRIARYPMSATFSGSITKNLKRNAPYMPALVAKAVLVEPGQSVVTVTPVPLSSALMPFDTCKIYAFVAA